MLLTGWHQNVVLFVGYRVAAQCDLHFVHVQGVTELCDCVKLPIL